MLLKDFNENEITSMVKWCSENNFRQSFIEVMPIGKTDLNRTNQFLPISIAQTKIRETYGLNPILLKTNGPSKYYQTSKLKNIIGFYFSTY